MSGHVFVLRGDLTELHCNGVLIPCDINWELIWDYWWPLLAKDNFVASTTWGAGNLRGVRLKNPPEAGRFLDSKPTKNGRCVRLVVTADGNNHADWVASGVEEAIVTFPARLGNQEGRAKPLVALPLVGTGEGGFRNRRGELIRTLVPALRRAARDADIDVALVLNDARDYAAVQSFRSELDWNEFTRGDFEIADSLGAKAARGELSLFLGAGVSVPLGLPDWKGLLERAGAREIHDYSPARAPEIAGELVRAVGPKQFYGSISKELTVSGFAPGHLLLADLGVTQTITTNYDNAYENALDGALGHDGYRVLTKQSARQPKPWLLKIHGDVARPRSMVITAKDYKRLRVDRKALLSMIDSLLLTSHLMFVGYSMEDPLLLQAAERVRAVRGLAEDRPLPAVATVLALHPEAILDRPGFIRVSMGPESNGNHVAARRLELFLDRIAWAATRDGRGSLAYLLDPDYDDLFAGDLRVARLRQALKELWSATADRPIQGDTLPWDRIELFLREVGATKRLWTARQRSSHSSQVDEPSGRRNSTRKRNRSIRKTGGSSR